jgi:F-type H+-transporting ATPase subunit gamma
MNGIRDTLKITNAMYLISSSKLRKARKNWQAVSDYFNTIQTTITDILGHMPDMEHMYLDPLQPTEYKHKRRAYIVITADKGLAGAYNLNVLKLAEDALSHHPDAKLFVIGEIGRHYFAEKHTKIVKDFLYSSQNPSLQRARSITAEVLEQFYAGEVEEVHLIYTKMKNALQSEAVKMKLLPLPRVIPDKTTRNPNMKESFFPDAKSVFGQVAPISTQGIIFSALIESYCAELNDRMTAMDGASKSAKEMLDELRLQYNRRRQYSITQEITEVCAGSRAQKNKKTS